LLRARGVDVEAFDAQPPSEDMNNDFFFQTRAGGAARVDGFARAAVPGTRA
jgi:hypothetical protein